MLRFFSTVLLLAVAHMLTSCEHASPFEPEGDGATLENVQETVFSTSCAVSGCHLGSSAPHGLDLSPGSAGDNLVGVDSDQLPAFKRVQPGNPDDSYLMMKIEGDSRIVGGRMPLGRSPLSGEQISLVREWIASLTL